MKPGSTEFEGRGMYMITDGDLCSRIYEIPPKRKHEVDRKNEKLSCSKLISHGHTWLHMPWRG